MNNPPPKAFTLPTLCLTAEELGAVVGLLRAYLLHSDPTSDTHIRASAAVNKLNLAWTHRDDSDVVYPKARFNREGENQR